MDEVIEIKYAPRVQQQQIHDLIDSKRFSVVVARRATPTLPQHTVKPNE
jgi:hypothetical protein